jgi:hypothetical protein
MPGLPYWLAVTLLPFLAVAIDGAAGVRSRNRDYVFGTSEVHDFRILVPIWGKVSYLVNVDYLRQYGRRVTLCTTGDESEAFYVSLREIATANGFEIFIAERTRLHGTARTHVRRTTSGTIRDRIIRDALQTVTEQHVVPLDADSTTVQSIALVVGELVRRNLDLASIRLVLNNPVASLLTRMQRFEYRLAMQMRFLAPWMISGACQVAKTQVLRDVMNRHSLFFQGNDVEMGLIAWSRGYKVGHIPFEVLTDVPSGLKPWVRQRLAWSGGEFRLFIVNSWIAVKHPFYWFYGGVVVIIGFYFRWLAITHPGYSLLMAFALYMALVVYLYWKIKSRWVLLMPFYMLISSMILPVFGVIWYFKMSVEGGNWGIIRPKRKAAVA